jgi:hypothetical protein
MDAKMRIRFSLICITLACLLVTIPATSRGETGTLDIQVSNGNDDAEERVSSGGMSLGSSDLELIYDNQDQIVGIRFQNVTIPQGSAITNAYIKFTTDEISVDATSLEIWCEKRDNPSSFTTSDYNISSRPKTSASVVWNDIPEWNSKDESGVAQQTPPLNAIIEEIVKMTTWSKGNAMVFIIEGSGKRVARAYAARGVCFQCRGCFCFRL